MTTSVFLILLILTNFLCTVSASGFYWSALRRQNETSPLGTKTEFPGVIPDIDTPPPIRSSLDLEELDENYSKCNGIDIREISILRLQSLFAAGMLTSLQITNCYLKRIHRMNTILKAVIEVNPDALNNAYLADLERQTPYKTRSPLHGIPILLKDNIATFDSMQTTAGSKALIGVRPKRDAGVVEALRQAGAIILGKGNLSEFSNFRGTNIPGGWSSRGGQTRNPYNINVTPEGSSSGPAVAVAANLVTVSIGSETDGSLIAPASINGICTIKPTHDLLSTKGVIPISHNQDTLGPMARNVLDLTLVMDALVPQRQQPCGGRYSECLLNKDYMQRKFRVGVLRQPFWNTSTISSVRLEFELPLLNLALQIMDNSSHFDIIDPVSFSPGALQEIVDKKELIVFLHDFKHGINNYLANDVTNLNPELTLSSKQHLNLSDIIRFNEKHPSRAGYNQKLLIMAEATDGIQNQTYIEVRNSNLAAAKYLLDSVFKAYHLDAIVVPSESRKEFVLDESLIHAPKCGWSVAAIAGYPSVNIPAGIGLNGAPFGISFLGSPYTEATLLQIAYLFETMNPKREKPKFFV